MSSAIHYNPGPSSSSSSNKPQRTFLERLADSLVYILAFPFIAVFIGMKNVFTTRQQPHRSYRSNLPQGKSI